MVHKRNKKGDEVTINEIENKLQSRHMLSEAEAATMFGISRCTLRCWRSMGKGPRYFKSGRTVRYRAEDIDTYLVGQPVETIDSLKQQQEG